MTANPFKNGNLIQKPASEYYAKQAVDRGHPNYVMSRSELSAFANNPQSWKLGLPNEETDATEWGSLLDLWLLTPDEFGKTVVVCPETYPAGPKHEKVRTGEIAAGDPLPWHSSATYCKDWVAQHEGKRIVSFKEMDALKDAAAAIARDEEARDLIANSQKQVWVEAQYEDEETELVVPVKILIDLVPDENYRREAGKLAFRQTLADFKTARSASQRTWQREVFSRRYHWQAKLYLDVWNAAFPETRDSFLQLIQESAEPYAIGRRIISEELLEMARVEYLHALRRYCRCLKEDFWPGYDDLPSDGMTTINGWTLVQPEAWMLKAV